jgi:hypothetical protein
VDPKTKKLLDKAAKNANPLNSEITVSGSVHVQAVLIPRIDYREWPLSGLPPAELYAQRSTNKYQAASVPSQVASEEYRVV